MDNNFDLKINQMQQVNQVEAKAPAPQAADGSFQFTLLSAIEETALAERLSGLLTDIEKEGKKIVSIAFSFYDAFTICISYKRC